MIKHLSCKIKYVVLILGGQFRSNELTQKTLETRLLWISSIITSPLEWYVKFIIKITLTLVYEQRASKPRESRHWRTSASLLFGSPNREFWSDEPCEIIRSIFDQAVIDEAPPPGGLFISSTLVGGGGGLDREEGFFNVVKMMVSILHKVLECKVEKASAHEKLDVITNKSELPAHE